ncbi:copia protein [Tanacetum coccineum]
MKAKSFRFANYIADKPEFIKKVEDGWKAQFHGSKIVELTRVKLQEAQTLVEKNPHNFLIKEKAVQALYDYNKTVKDEEKLLAKKARINWLNEGDKNNSFFHKVIKGRRSRNRVVVICDEQGIVKTYSALLTQDGAEDMIKDVSDKEIKEAMFDIEDNKAPEILRGYGRQQGPKRCAIKIDLQKAYDTVNWDFLEIILNNFGFHQKMVGWIMKCVRATGFSMCINEERHGYFKGGRGLRQRDPMSPYLFTLIMEMLTLILQRKIRNNDSFEYHHGCKELQLVNLCFADDFMIFCNGDPISVGLIKDALNEFSEIFRMFPNLNKSTLFFGSLKDADKEQIKDVMHFNEGMLPLKYLGVPLITKRLGVRDLSWASVFKLPKTVVNEVNGILKRFLWSNGDSAKGKTKIAWKYVCRPKEFGGLAVKEKKAVVFDLLIVRSSSMSQSCYKIQQSDSEDDSKKEEICLMALDDNEVRLKVKLKPDEWIKYSGCSRHMTGNKDLFSSYKTIDGDNVVFGGNTKSKIVRKGTGVETIIYANSDHAGYYIDRKSISGVCTFMGCCLTLWFSKKQTALAVSTIESQDNFITEKACQQALWMKQALIDYDINLDNIPVLCDNKGAIDLSKNPVLHSRIKHIEIRHHFLRDNVQKGNISIEKVSSEDNIADILTKPLKREPFNLLRLGLGLMEPNT